MNKSNDVLSPIEAAARHDARLVCLAALEANLKPLQRVGDTVTSCLYERMIVDCTEYVESHTGAVTF